MNRKDTTRLLEMCRLERRKVRVTRRFPRSMLHGFVVGVGERFALLQNFHDFYCEGYCALQLDDVLDVRSGENERFWEQMFEREGLLNNIGIDEVPPLHSTSALLEHVRERYSAAIVIAEDPNDEAEDDWHFGSLVSVDDLRVRIWNLDPLGKWCERVDELATQSVTRVDFDTPYVNTYLKYAR